MPNDNPWSNSASAVAPNVMPDAASIDVCNEATSMSGTFTGSVPTSVNGTCTWMLLVGTIDCENVHCCGVPGAGWNAAGSMSHESTSAIVLHCGTPQPALPPASRTPSR